MPFADAAATAAMPTFFFIILIIDTPPRHFDIFACRFSIFLRHCHYDWLSYCLPLITLLFRD